MMKKRNRILSLLVVLLAPAVQAANLTFQWDPFAGDQNILAVRLYEVGNPVPLGIATQTNTITLLNYQASALRTFYATSSNVLGESLQSNPVSVPRSATPPTNVILKVTSLDTVPVPGVIELSRDLNSWKERIRVAPSAGGAPGEISLALVQYPTEPAWFMRVAPPALTGRIATPPPIP